MDWMKITVLTTTIASEIVSQMLIDAGSQGTIIEDKNDVQLNQRPEGQWDIIDEAIAERIGDDVKVTGYYEVDASLSDRVRFVEGEIARANGKLNNPGFLSKAPAHLVEQEKEKLKTNQSMLESLIARIADLKG